MDLRKYLEKVADISPSRIPDDLGSCYLSKFDGSYITRVGMEEDAKLLADLEITEELTHGVGFSPLHNKWYGWSHRACYGFTIGSKCEKGDCHYTPSTIPDMLESLLQVWYNREKVNLTGKIEGTDILLQWDELEFDESKDLVTVTIKETISHDEYLLGKGEWVAKTMEDAKQMAIDFNESVS